MEKEQFIKEVVPQRDRLLTYAHRLLNDRQEAEDIVQETFLKLWGMRLELDNYHNRAALSVQITKRLCLNRLKVLKRNVTDLEAIEVISDTPTPFSQLSEKDHLEQVMRIIDQLPDLQQAILKMKHVEGLEIEEIAALTGSSNEAVRVNLSRGRKRVKELFFKNLI